MFFSHYFLAFAVALVGVSSPARAADELFKYIGEPLEDVPVPGCADDDACIAIQVDLDAVGREDFAIGGNVFRRTRVSDTDDGKQFDYVVSICASILQLRYINVNVQFVPYKAPTLGKARLDLSKTNCLTGTVSVPGRTVLDIRSCGEGCNFLAPHVPKGRRGAKGSKGFKVE